MGDLYSDLGVSRDASAEDIKAAHWRLVKETHPDAGGDRDKFERVQRAVTVLSDPAKRARYDQTGAAPDINPEDSLEMKAMSAISVRLNGIVQSPKFDPRFADVTLLLREDLNLARGQLQTQIEETRARQKRIQQFQRRLTRKKKAEGADHLGPILDAQHQALEALIQAAGDELAVVKRAKELVADYEYRVDPQQAVTLGTGGRGHWIY